MRISSKSVGIDPILLRDNAPIAFQKIPTEKKVKLTAPRKSIRKILINKKVTNKPVPEEMEPLRMPIKNIGIIKLNSRRKRLLFLEEYCPKLGLRKEYNDKKIEKIPIIKYKY